MKILECVPNFSEGKNQTVINEIALSISGVAGVKLLHIDSGKAANRTVYTFAGEPQAVIEAAFQSIKTAMRYIDMRHHQGEHPRVGATDVCPLVPVSGITLEDAVEYSIQLAKRVGEELQLPVFMYEHSASAPHRKHLSSIRKGQFECLGTKLQQAEWQPDFGPSSPHPSAGATVIGARDFLIAYNINLNTTSSRLAAEIAAELRESGKVKRIGDPFSGEVVYDELGEMVRLPGKLEAVRAIGWFIEEYKTAQISMNITDIHRAPLHKVFEEAETQAVARGARVTGSEIVGLVPLKALIESGVYFLKKQGRSAGVPEEEIITIAIKTLGLEEVNHFDPHEKILEYVLEQKQGFNLTRLSLRDYVNEISSEAPVPGGGSAAAYTGALAAGLTAMVANVSANKRGWDQKVTFFSEIAEKAQGLKDALLVLSHQDAEAFKGVMHARKLYGKKGQEDHTRKDSLQLAYKRAAEIPLLTMERSHECIPLLRSVLSEGISAAREDAKVASILMAASAEAAYQNVKVNLEVIEDDTFSKETFNKALILLENCMAFKEDVLKA